MRIAIATTSYPEPESEGRAAAGGFVRAFAHALLEQDHEVEVVTQRAREAHAVESGVRVHTFYARGTDRPASTLSLRRPADWAPLWDLVFRGARSLARLDAARPLDHVLAMWAVPAGHWAWNLRKNRGVSYSVWVLGSDVWEVGRRQPGRLWVRTVLRGAKACFADGLQLREAAEALAGRECRFLPSCRDLSKISLRKGEPGDGKPTFLFLGRWHPNKGVDVLIEALRTLSASERAGLRVLIYGGGPLEEEVKRAAKDPTLSEIIALGGYVDENSAAELITASSAVVIPSRIESIPVVFSDALQLGRPVIVTDVGDIGALVRKNRCGIVVPPEDPVLLGRALINFAQAGDVSYREGTSALAKRFSVDASARTFLAKIGIGENGGRLC